MFRFFRTAILGVVLGCASCASPVGEAPSGAKMSRKNIITEIESSTAALVKEVESEEVPYCAGVWVDTTHLLTALHCVVNEPNFAVLIKTKSMFDNTTSPTQGVVVNGNVRVDLALVEVSYRVPLHGIARINTSKPVQGDHVHVIGHTAGYPWTYTEGSISSYRKSMRGPTGEKLAVVQVSGFVWMGNSGGGAWNSEGELVGIASWIDSRVSGVAFFISGEEIKHFLQEKQ